MVIRAATADDSAALAHIQITSYRAAYAAIFPQAYLDQFSHEEQTTDWRDLIESDSNALLYVAANAGGDAVGYALAQPKPVNDHGYASELVAIHVLPDHQRRGIGRDLFGAVASELRQRGYRSLMLWVLEENPARRFYEQLGGRKSGEQQIDLDGTMVNEIAYGWARIEELCARLGRPSYA